LNSRGGIDGLIAALPMYCWPENEAEVDAQWAELRLRILRDVPEAPERLTKSGDLHDLWLSPRLLIAQTCSYPLATALAGRVRYLATPSYDAAGCQTPGHYRSAIIMRGTGPDTPVPVQGALALPALDADATFAFNTADSMSGLHGLKADLAAAGRSLPARTLMTGGHRQSIVAVSQGRADFAAIDCVSWQMAKRFEPAAQMVTAIGWTSQRPGLPLITSLETEEATAAALVNAAAEVFSALVLDPVFRLQA
jgi:ABC-type phosphate/phosphonate transport system substrate-binding protein